MKIVDIEAWYIYIYIQINKRIFPNFAQDIYFIAKNNDDLQRRVRILVLVIKLDPIKNIILSFITTAKRWE